ncbi:MAG: hypothetical protein EU529_07610 [Promethearchaeota archaeon]|nr:MAG: hypothetical protein EU529_07610 [Candidatus Lokiarchaeota archaeon]
MKPLETEGEIKEIVLEKFEKLSLKMEQLRDEISKMKFKLDKSNKMNRTFGLKTLRNSEPLNFAKDVNGIGSPTKNYVLSIRAITEEWKGRQNDIMITIRQQDKETQQDLKSLGIRIPINDIKKIRNLSKEIISLLFVACELKGIEINDILREILLEVNEDGSKMINEIKQKMVF